MPHFTTFHENANWHILLNMLAYIFPEITTYIIKDCTGLTLLLYFYIRYANSMYI